MAKEFEHYNDKYRKLSGTALRDIAKVTSGISHQTISEIRKWHLDDLKYTGHYSIKLVANAVYPQQGMTFEENQDREKWQMFRVALKGLSTKEKLFCVEWWWTQSKKDEIAQIRVNNYIGALVRGGQLKANLEVQR